MIDSRLLTFPGMSTFDERLSQALKSAGKTAADLAPRLRSSTGEMGVSKQAVHQALNGDTKSMTAENVARAARFLGCDFYWLATGEQPAEEPDNQWPFEAIDRAAFTALTERQKGEVEKAAMDALSQIAARAGNRKAPCTHLAGQVLQWSGITRHPQKVESTDTGCQVVAVSGQVYAIDQSWGLFGDF